MVRSPSICLIAGLTLGLLVTAYGRLFPEADHTVWLVFESAPSGADVRSASEDAASSISLGNTPCRVPVDFRWQVRWWIKRWTELQITAPGDICRVERTSNDSYRVFVNVVLTKPGYDDYEINKAAFELVHPGKGWTNRVVWPTEVVLRAVLQPTIADDGSQVRDGGVQRRRVLVAASDSNGGTGTLIVSCNVEAAQLWWGDKILGETPLEIVMPAGFHTLSLRKRGFAPVVRTVTVEPDTTIHLRVRLQPLE